MAKAAAERGLSENNVREREEPRWKLSDKGTRNSFPFSFIVCSTGMDGQWEYISGRETRVPCVELNGG